MNGVEGRESARLFHLAHRYFCRFIELSSGSNVGDASTPDRTSGAVSFRAKLPHFFPS
jgi:hypothetical protein